MSLACLEVTTFVLPFDLLSLPKYFRANHTENPYRDVFYIAYTHHSEGVDEGFDF